MNVEERPPYYKVGDVVTITVPGKKPFKIRVVDIRPKLREPQIMLVEAEVFE